MSQSLEALLHEAIYSNDLKLVQSCLDNGADPNKPSPIPSRGLANEVGDKTIWVLRKPNTIHRLSSIFPVHMAILNCLYCFDNRVANALAIVKALLRHGADLDSSVANVTVRISDAKIWRIAPSHCPNTRGFLRFLLADLAPDPSFKNLLQVKDLIEGEYSVPLCYQVRGSYQENVLTTMDSLLLSERFSDVCFVCPDATSLHAHRCILSAKSVYFATFFEGPWKDASSDGKWETTNSSSVMEAVLRFIYVGKLMQQVVEKETTELFQVASKYQMEDLQEICVQQLALNLSSVTIKETLLLAYLHDVGNIKQACIKYVRTNSLKLLGASNAFNDLATDERTADIWKELVRNCLP